MDEYVIYTEDHCIPRKIERWYYGTYKGIDRVMEVLDELGDGEDYFRTYCPKALAKELGVLNMPY